MSLLNNATLSNTTTPYYALAAESGKNWYQFPSQTGEIELIDASGTQVIQSINGNLYYNNQLLAQAGQIQDIADWSLYPALATVGLNGKNISQGGDISSATVHVTSLTATGITAAGITASGSIGAGSVTATGNIQGASLTTTGGLDMVNTAITRASAVNISSGGFAPYGALTSPDGVMLTWNGQTVNTGGAGNVSQWANYPAVTNVNANTNNINNVGTITATNVATAGGMTISGNTITGATSQNVALTSSGNLTETVTGNLTQSVSGALLQTVTGNITQDTYFGNIERNAYGSINDKAYGEYKLLVDRLLTPLGAPITLEAKDGLGGNIQLIARQSATIEGESLGYGEIGLSAYGSTNETFSLGGKIDINAYSGVTPGEYGGATSRVSVGAATVSLSAGAIPNLPGLAGSMNVFGNGAVSIVSDLTPPLLPQIPETVYIFGRGAVRLESGQFAEVDGGVQMLSDTYAGNIYPITDSDLILQGRTLPNGYVKIRDCNEFTMTTDGIAKTNEIQAVGSPGDAVTIDNITGNLLSADTQTLLITGKVNVGSDYYVDISMANAIAFDAAGAGALTGVQTINGSAYPPAPGDVSQWATFKAVQNVDMSGNGLINVANINTLTNATITSAGSLGIFSDLSGDLSLAAAGGGNVNIGNGSLGNINIEATGHTVTVGGTEIVLSTPTVNVSSGDIINVANLTGASIGSQPLSIFSYSTMGVSAVNNVTVESQDGVLQLLGDADVNIDSTTGGINLASTTQVIVETSVLNMNNHKITNLTAGTVSGDAVNFNQLTFRDTTEFYVSSQGNDANNGSILSPKLTIQAAITAAELISSAANICVINVASGHYTETLTFNKGYIVLNGSLQTQTGNEVCEITGSINIACVGANDVFNRQVTFQGFNLTMVGGQSISNTSTSSHTVAFQDCKCFADNVFYTSSATSADMRTYFTNMEITSVSALNTATVISTNVGLVEFERVDLTVNGNAIGIAVAGTSVLNRLSLSTLDNTNSAVILKPLINITSSTLSTHSLGNVAFAFTSAVAKTASNPISIASGVNTAIIMLNCVFTLAGTASSTNYCVSYNGVGSPTIAGVNNTSLSVNVLLPQTVTVQPGISQIAYIDINPPGLASYSSTADQVIAVSGTPQALTYNTTQFNQGTTLVAGSRVYANAQGNYALSYSVELQHTGAGVTQTATIFLKKNGTTIANTGRQWSIASGNIQIAAIAEFVVSLNTGDYVEVFFNGDTSLSANATAAAGALPAIPSVVFNIKQFR